MRARVPRFLTAGLVPRATILGMLASLLAIAPMGALTPAAHAATGTITEFNNSNRHITFSFQSIHPVTHSQFATGTRGRATVQHCRLRRRLKRHATCS